MTYYNEPGPIPNRDELQQEKIDRLDPPAAGILPGLPGGPKRPSQPPEYLPPEYDSSANTTSFAVYSVTGMPASGLPAVYNTHPMDENLRYNRERTQPGQGLRYQ